MMVGMSLNEKGQGGDYTPLRAAKFYIPLVLQAISQSLTYPLVASIVSHGKNGVVDLAAFAQGLAVMFLIGAFGGGLITTGMVFGRNIVGYRQYVRLVVTIASVLVVFQGVVCIPPLDRIVFQQVIGLSPEMYATARDVLLFSIPLQFFFFMRSPGLVPLYNVRASGSANIATMCRIIITAMLSPLFVRMGWVGHRWGLLAMTGPVMLEMILVNLLARKHVRQLEPPRDEPAATVRTQFAFTAPLALGGVLLAVASFMIGAFISRAAEPERMLPLHYVAMGVVNPVSFAAIRMQALVLAFPPRDKRDHSIFRFALAAGLLLAAVPLVGQLPGVAQWYFGKVQNVPADDIPLAMRTMLLLAVMPVVQALRGHAEGLAAWRRRPNAILAGQAMNLAVLVCTLFITLQLGVPGYMMGAISISAAVVMTLATVRLGLAGAEMEDKFGTPPPRGLRPADE